jgi:vancomycin resistance protein YoaR
MKNKNSIIAVLGFLLLSIFMLISPEQVDAAAGSTIRKGVFLDDIDVSGKTAEEATALVEEHMSELQDYKMHLKIGTEFITVSTGDLGLTWANPEVVEQALSYGKVGNIVERYKVLKDLSKKDVSLSIEYAIDDEQVTTLINDQCVPFNQDPINPTLTREDGEFQIVKGEEGRNIRVEDSLEAIRQYITGEWRAGDSTIELAVDIKEPDASEEELAKVTDVLGSSSTDYSSSSAARKTNIKTGTSKISGHTIYPGESFSVEENVVPFDEASGYAKAPSYESGEVVETYGGGICQVSTTLYLAVLRAELQVDERHNHSMIVTYVQPSMDAAVAEGSKDFIFTNNTAAPIYIEGYADGATVGFTVYGQEYRDTANRSITFESVTTSTEEPTNELTATNAPIGTITQVASSSHQGLTAELWKIITVNGEETREQVNDSSYAMQPNKYEVGVTSDDASLTSRMYTAIDSNDLNAVYNVINGG